LQFHEEGGIFREIREFVERGLFDPMRGLCAFYEFGAKHETRGE
jgi:hypothetical protein